MLPSFESAAEVFCPRQRCLRGDAHASPVVVQIKLLEAEHEAAAADAGRQEDVAKVRLRGSALSARHAVGGRCVSSLQRPWLTSRCGKHCCQRTDIGYRHCMSASMST